MDIVPFRLYVVSDRTRMGADPAGAVAALVHAGLAAFQWREKDLSPAENLEWLCAIHEAVGGRIPASPSRIAEDPAATRSGSRSQGPAVGNAVVRDAVAGHTVARDTVAGHTVTGGVAGGVHFPWQITPSPGPAEASEPVIHHRAPHGTGQTSPELPPAGGDTREVGRPPGSGPDGSGPGATPKTAAARVSATVRDCPQFHLFVNDRADLALVAGCHLHLAEPSIPTASARALLPAGRLVGRSTHTIEGAMNAARGGADFVTFGPVFDTPSKRGYGPPQGIARLHGVCATVPIPVFALGGVTVDRIAECLEAGAHGVAMISAVWDDPDPVAALRRCLDAFMAS